MKQNDNSLQNQTYVYFHTPSAAAREFLYYPLAGGIFERGKNYRVHRLQYDSVLLAYITEGNLQLIQGGKHFRAENGELLLVDCYKEHEYFTDSYVKFTWIHMDGSSSRPWLDSMIKNYGRCMKMNSQCHALMLSAIDGIKNREDEYRLSRKLHTLMCEIALSQEGVGLMVDSSVITQAKDYMEAHLEERLNVKQIAEQVHYSPSYFSQVFKHAVKMSPYEYLLSRRIERAKSLLLQTEYPLEIIAARSGFQGISHFIYAFKKSTGLSPLKFRKLGL